jgi:hypothetical protein
MLIDRQGQAVCQPREVTASRLIQRSWPIQKKKNSIDRTIKFKKRRKKAKKAQKKRTRQKKKRS